MALLNILLNTSNGWPWQSGWMLVGPLANRTCVHVIWMMRGR
jgi:hypothetical protein